MKRFIGSFLSFFAGLKYIHKNSLKRYLFFPSLLSLLIGTGLSILLFQIFYATLLNTGIWIFNLIGIDVSLAGVEITGLMNLVLQLIALFFSLVLFVIFFSALASVLVLPFLGPMLKQMELRLKGKALDISFRQEIKNLRRSAAVSLKFLGIGGLVFLGTLPFGPLQILFMMPVQGYFLGHGTFSYLFEKEDPDGGKPLTRKFFPEILGIGCAYFLLLFIPIIGTILAPAAALSGAALLYYSPDSPSASSSESLSESSPESS